MTVEREQANVRSRLRSRAGLSLVEVVVAMMVLSFGLLGLLGSAASAIRSTAETDRTVSAAYFANERMERLQALGCDAMSSGNEVRQNSYTVEWSVSGVATSRSRDVHLTVEYPVRAGRQQRDVFERAITCLR